jgi:hypothetical protein
MICLMPGVIAGGDKREARRSEEWGSWEEAVTPPHQLGVCGGLEAPSMGSGESPVSERFRAFITLRLHPLDHEISY